MDPTPDSSALDSATATSSCSPHEGSGAVLLTGATGFLGGYVCAELLRQTKATVHCLVRGRSLDGARVRLAHHLRLRGIQDTGRVVTVLGDLTKFRFGLPIEEVTELGAIVGSVYHCGASTNLAAGYDELAPINIGGTNELLRFARSGRPKAFHHVSTLGIFIGGCSAGLFEASEATMPTEAATGGFGYARSKVVAERAVRRAGNLGLAVTVYRPGLVVADSSSGVSTNNTIDVRLIKAAVVVGKAPRNHGTIYLGRAEDVARAIVALSLTPDAAGRTFHVIQPRPFATYDLFRYARDYGYSLSDVSVEAWWAALTGAMITPAAFAALALRHIAEHLFETDARYRTPVARCDETTRALSAIGIDIPEMGPSFFARELSHLVASKILPPPACPTA